ncbi:MAG: hypothetical protein IJJ26_09495, partial [Victivallales bacterium]|nr:hypothetical protein [Victivallales bacterium]
MKNLVLVAMLLCIGVLHGETAIELYDKQNWAEALPLFRSEALSKETASAQAAVAYKYAVACLSRLHREKEFDELLEAFLAAHPKDWQCALAAANSYSNIPHHGLMLGGKFVRNAHGRGRYVNTSHRDRVHALRLLLEAMPLMEAEGAPNNARRDFYLSFLDAIHYDSNTSRGLFHLTDLTQLPDWEAPQPEVGWNYPRQKDGVTPV